MKTIQKPPRANKKGIKIMQIPPAPLKPSEHSEQSTSQYTTSSRSSRNRGISMSRQSGITLDKIYQARHFIPSKNTQANKIKNQQKTLGSYRSLKLLSVANLSESSELQKHKQTSGIEGEGGKVIKVQGFLQKKELGGCGSPILRLRDRLQQKDNQPEGSKSTFRKKYANLINF